MTFVEQISNGATFAFSETVSYKCPYSASELEKVVALCERVFSAKFTDNPSVRLDSVERSEDGSAYLRLSPVGFFGFLTTHYAWLNREKLLENAAPNETAALMAFVDRLKRDGIPNSINEVLKRDYLANMLAISCLIRDESDRALLVVRNASVGISTGFVSVSATGVIEREDIAQGQISGTNMTCACAKRECFEELGIDIPIADFKTVAIVCGEEKLQPVALVDAMVKDMGEIVAAIKANPGFVKENTSFMVCSRGEVADLLASPEIKITEAGRAHLESMLLNA